MFHETFQSGFLSIFFSIGSNPLEIWNTAIQNGSIRRISDEDIQSSVLEISGSNVATTYMTCPAMPDKTLGIKLPYFVLVLKNVSNIEVDVALIILFFVHLYCFRCSFS